MEKKHKESKKSTGKDKWKARRDAEETKRKNS